MTKNKQSDINSTLASNPEADGSFVTVREDGGSNDLVWLRPSHLRPVDEFAVDVYELMEAIQVATGKVFSE